MADQFDAMVSGVPSDPAMQQALAAQLRRQAALGSMSQLTGDRVLSPWGAGQQKEAQQQGESLAGERESQNSLAQTLALKEAEMKQQRAIADQNNQRQIEANANTNQLRRDLLAEQIAGRSALQTQKDQDKADAAAHGGKPLPMGTFKDVAALSDSYNAISDSIANYKPEYSGAGMASRKGTNWLAANAPTLGKTLGVVNQQDQDAANWYQNYGRNFTIDEMHRLFGARISPTEMATFETYHINPNQPAEVQMLNMTQIQKRVADKINQRLDSLSAAGYNRDQIADLRPGKGSTDVAPGAPPSAMDQYIAAGRAATQSKPNVPTAAPPPAAPLAMPPPQGGALPQSRSLYGQSPFVPGLNNLFQGLPGQQQ
jgi:hypothetical protein